MCNKNVIKLVNEDDTRILDILIFLKDELKGDYNIGTTASVKLLAKDLMDMRVNPNLTYGFMEETLKNVMNDTVKKDDGNHIRKLYIWLLHLYVRSTGRIPGYINLPNRDEVERYINNRVLGYEVKKADNEKYIQEQCLKAINYPCYKDLKKVEKGIKMIDDLDTAIIRNDIFPDTNLTGDRIRSIITRMLSSLNGIYKEMITGFVDSFINISSGLDIDTSSKFSMIIKKLKVELDILSKYVITCPDVTDDIGRKKTSAKNAKEIEMYSKYSVNEMMEFMSHVKTFRDICFECINSFNPSDELISLCRILQLHNLYNNWNCKKEELIRIQKDAPVELKCHEKQLKKAEEALAVEKNLVNEDPSLKADKSALKQKQEAVTALKKSIKIKKKLISSNTKDKALNTLKFITELTSFIRNHRDSLNDYVRKRLFSLYHKMHRANLYLMLTNQECVNYDTEEINYLKALYTKSNIRDISLYNIVNGGEITDTTYKGRPADIDKLISVIEAGSYSA